MMSLIARALSMTFDTTDKRVAGGAIRSLKQSGGWSFVLRVMRCLVHMASAGVEKGYHAQVAMVPSCSIVPPHGCVPFSVL